MRVSPELMQAFAPRLREAAEMGDVTQLESIAEELKSRSVAMAAVCDNITHPAQDFDVEGVIELLAGWIGSLKVAWMNQTCKTHDLARRILIPP